MDITLAKENMLNQQIRACDVKNSHVIEVIKRIPRELFVPQHLRGVAYSDMHIPLEHNQEMLTPLEEAQILSALKIKPTDKILEIGTGTGYLTCLLACLGLCVDSVDIFPEFTVSAQNKLREMHIYNTHLITDNAATGWKNGPYDVIVITGALSALPNGYKELLEIGGRLFAILGSNIPFEATLIERVHDQTWSEKHLFETSVPYLLNATKPSQFIF